ncbi:MAG: nucleotide exchange factor GrpE [Methanotrichaceae archaeon]|nr:nucleotide exchange factor GrpE [Methanotrichaceae archaeon]
MANEEDVEMIEVQEDKSVPASEKLISESELKDLQRQLEESQKVAEERFDLLQRCRADLENIIKRTAKEKEEYANYASQKLICKLLTILDSLEQASNHDEGGKILYQQLLDILKSEGLQTIEALGKKFDPYIHEALFQIESENNMDEDIVVQEIQKGYMLNSKVIRFSKVAVGKRG